jgi:hypothetical protein
MFPLSGHCGAPFETEDPNTIAAGQVELLFFYASTLQAAGRSGSAPGLEVHLGALDGLEVDLVADLAFDRPGGGPTRWGTAIRRSASNIGWLRSLTPPR